ncbi:molybdenum cofactor guanylyltransferase [Halobacillus litoralis]|uniref:molybdenum cofactor guanylyltransferase n=1 Tax=Halobacillus litoralis TaxID=45668 RepID=UPI001CD5BD49|nr:molybdenum cofactor guanylyltransferase [Halobacillus litoralis]MCA0970408.1 molybdenum cofactor guanylyltransferase [Halobacillus litoralis]
MTLAGVILAGGGSSRMGRDKASLPLGSRTVLARIYSQLHEVTSHIVVNSNIERSGFEPVPDRYVDGGPLAGIQAGMQAAGAEWVVVSACDTPFIHPDIYKELLSYRDSKFEAIIPFHKGRHQPMSGVYHISLLPLLDELMNNDEKRMRALYERINMKPVHSFQTVSESVLSHHFFNMNTLEDYEEANRLLKTFQGQRHLL